MQARRVAREALVFCPRRAAEAECCPGPAGCLSRQSACPGTSKPQRGVTFQNKLRRDLAKLEDAPKLPGRIDVSCLREWLLQEQRKSLPGGERKRRQR